MTSSETRRHGTAASEPLYMKHSANEAPVHGAKYCTLAGELAVAVTVAHLLLKCSNVKEDGGDPYGVSMGIDDPYSGHL